MQAALATRHMGRIIRAYREHQHHGRRGPSQDDVATWSGYTQGWISQTENGPPVNQLDRLVFWAELLGVPNAASGSACRAESADTMTSSLRTVSMSR